MPLEDKTEAPTPRRRRESREEGQVARSVELCSALVLLSALLILRYIGPGVAEKIRRVIIVSLTQFPKHDLVIGEITSKLVRILLDVGLAFLPLLIGVAAVGFASSALQVGLVISSKPLQFKADRLNPIAGLGRMFSVRAWMEMGKAVAKILVVGYIVYSFIKDKYSVITSMTGGDYLATCSEVGRLTWELVFRATLALFVIAGLDYMFQRMQLEKQIKMTKQEVKDDSRRTEGDPAVKSKIRQKQREVAQRRMMQEVPKADVIVTNPTHIAVALRYDADKTVAPVVVAKGKRLVAEKIKQIAQENNVPIVESVMLARALYASVEIGDEIPADLYQAVAEILAYVYRLSNKVANAA